MKPFNLEAAKAGAPVCTRDGRAVRFLCFDRENDRYPIVGLIRNLSNSYEDVVCWSTKGHYVDLLMASIKREGWIRVYKHKVSNLNRTGCSIYTNHQEALEVPPGCDWEVVDVIPINWEE